jgi:RNA polymerase sigma-B factor
VEQHLALAHHVAERYVRASGCRGGAGADDVHGAACSALVPCIERFDARQGHRLSSYAVPYLHGAIRHHLRDQWQPVKVPRRLLELQQRSCSRQKRRLQQGLEPLTATQLAQELGTSTAQLKQAQEAWRVLQVDSLQELAEPASPEHACDPARDWLLEQLAAMPPADRQLIEGIWIQPQPKRALAARLGLSVAALNSRGAELLDQLRQKARASSAAMVV